ncbi:hypothetical protein [Mongoliitalea daihaiensis]|uniref:hypothetical protein n=1 Tax=Mongoliitalea daihaiensis TaxID=2782006 RepID=UPI001F255A81|nr:hypothetical protein [Mongoliitalea daihaiensis]UJP66124.1 outer membrane beta-barrel protein [Mongoliitalea daihaiensis]
MKKNLVSLLLLFLITASLSAQTEEGIWMIGGQVSLSSGNNLRIGSANFPDTRSTSNTYAIQPSIGYFFKKNWVLGGNIGFQSSNSTLTNNQTGANINQQNQRSGQAGIFTRKFIPINEQVFFHLQAGVAYTFGTFETIQFENNPILRKNSGISLNTRAGITYFPRRWIAIEGAVNPLNYLFEISKTPQGTGERKERVHSFSTGLNGNFLSLGFNFFISKPR